MVVYQHKALNPVALAIAFALGAAAVQPAFAEGIPRQNR